MMIRLLILFVVVGAVLGVSYFSSQFLMKPTAKVISNQLKQLSPLEYSLTTVSGKNFTRIVVLFNKKINTSCVDYVKIDNVSENFNVSKLIDQEVEIVIPKRIVGAHQVEINFCGSVLKDVIVVR